MDLENSFNSLPRFNAFDDFLFRQDQERQKRQDAFQIEQQRRQELDRDYGLMHCAPRMPMM